jgi:Zn-dependent protease
MIHLAKALRWFFVANAALFAVLCVRSVPKISIFAGHDWTATVVLLVQPAGFLSLAFALGMAFWKLRKGGAEAQRWALAASLLMIVLYWALPLALLWPATGIVGLAVFGRRETVDAMVGRKRALPRVRGDGTSSSVDGFAKFAMIAGCVAACYFWAGWATAHGFRADDKIFLWVLYIELATLLTTMVHESGHAIAALLLNMKIRHFVIGPLTGSFRSAQWEFEFSPMGLLGAPGSVGVVPASVENLRNRHAMVAAAGPLASLVFGAAATWAALTAKGHPWEAVWRLLAFTSTFSLMSFAFNLIPARPDSEYSDGARIYQLLRQGPWSDVHLALSMASCTLASSTRPRDMDIEVIQRAKKLLTGGTEALLLRVQEKCYFHDNGRIPEALEALAGAERVFEESQLTLRPDLCKSFVFDNALLKKDAAAARLWWNRMDEGKHTTSDAKYWMSYSALLLVEGSLDEAEVAAQLSAHLIQQYPRTGACEYEHYCLEQLRHVIEQNKVPVPEYYFDR